MCDTVTWENLSNSLALWHQHHTMILSSSSGASSDCVRLNNVTMHNGVCGFIDAVDPPCNTLHLHKDASLSKATGRKIAVNKVSLYAFSSPPPSLTWRIEFIACMFIRVGRRDVYAAACLLVAFCNKRADKIESGM